MGISQIGGTFKFRFYLRLPVRLRYNPTQAKRRLEWGTRLTSFTQTLEYDPAYAPFGENYAGSGPNQDLGYTQGATGSLGILQTHGTYDFPFRKYPAVQGRWISPDPAGMAAADPTNPQSWNRYAYVMNNPPGAPFIRVLCE